VCDVHWGNSNKQNVGDGLKRTIRRQGGDKEALEAGTQDNA